MQRTISLMGVGMSRQKKSKSTSMNKDLQQWVSEDGQHQSHTKPNRKKSEKKPKGMCQICGLKMAKHVCIKCGKSVCNSCYVKLVGLCEKCLSKQTVREWKNKKPDWKKVLEVEWID